MGKRLWQSMLVVFASLGMATCSDIPSEYKPFFQLPPGKMEKAILDYSLQQQIDIMIIGWTIPHPPYMLYSDIAKNGEPIVPLLIQRFSKINDMYKLRPIVLCLYEVNLRHFEWTTHQNNVEMWEKAIEEKANPALQREVRAILETGKPHPFFKGMKHGRKVDE